MQGFTREQSMQIVPALQRQTFVGRFFDKTVLKVLKTMKNYTNQNNLMKRNVGSQNKIPKGKINEIAPMMITIEWAGSLTL